MREYTLSHLSDAILLRNLSALVHRERGNTAELLAHVAEVDERRLYAPAGYPSMFAYCVEELHLSEDAAGRRIQAARAGRRFPALLVALEDGRLHLTAVCLLAPHVTPENVEALIAAATHKGKVEIEGWLAGRFMTMKVPTRGFIIRPIPATHGVASGKHSRACVEGGAGASAGLFDEHALAHVEGGPSALAGDEHALAHVDSKAAETARAQAPAPAAAPSSAPAHASGPAPERFLIQMAISKSTRDKLRYAQALLSHAVDPRDVPQVFDRALDALISALEKRRFGLTNRSRGGND